MSFLRGLRRASRAAALLLMAYPHSIVAVPLAIGLLVHMIEALVTERALFELRYAELLQCAGILTALTLFTLFSVAYVAILLYQGWKGDGAAGSR